MKTKVLLEDKLVTWRRAYGYVLEELRVNTTYSGVMDNPTHELRAAAARTAALLIQGVSHDGDSSAD